MKSAVRLPKNFIPGQYIYMIRIWCFNQLQFCFIGVEPTELNALIILFNCIPFLCLVPSEPPAKISGDAISPTALLIKWESVPENGEPSCCIHGILTGYKVWYGKRYPQPGSYTFKFHLIETCSSKSGLHCIIYSLLQSIALCCIQFHCFVFNPLVLFFIRV